MDQISQSMQSLSIDVADIAKLEEILNYEFNNKSLLEEALTHSSMTDSKSYERLEFLGDSVLGYLVAKHLFSAYPDLREGDLTLLRSGNVDAEKFARVFVKHKFRQFLRMKQSPELKLNIENFVKAIEDESEFKPPKVLGDIVESIAGAVLVDSGHCLDQVWKVFLPLLEPLVTLETLEKNPVTELGELCQKYGKHKECTYSTKDNRVRVEVLIDGKVVGIGENQLKDLADKAAAKHAVDKLKEMLKEDIVETARKNEKDSAGHLNNFCNNNHWPPPSYRIFQEDGPLSTNKFICAVSVLTDNGWTQEYIGYPMPREKEAKRSAAKAILDSFNVNNFT